MSLINRIKNIFNNNEIEEIKKIEDNSKFQNNRFKNIKIFAPDLIMEDENREDYTVQILDGNNNPIANEQLELYVKQTPYKRKTNKEGYVSLPIKLRAKKYIIETNFPSNEEYSPRVIAELNILTENQDFPREYREKNTRLYAPNMVIFHHDEPDYCVRLMDEDNNPISGEKITLSINEDSYEKTTDEEGFASFDLELPENIYELETKFDGNEKYDAICKTSKLEVRTRRFEKKLMIDVDHLAMEFKVSKDKIDTLKEYLIRTLKRNKKEAKKVRILDDISFKVYEGEKLGILGFNGAGKSTLLRIISGIYEPSEGSVKINGKIAPLLEISAGFDKNYTGKNNIFLNGAFLSMDEQFIKDKYDEIIEFSELGEFINYPVKNYSKGMRAKLGFSIATLVEPEILIIDEILAVGDIKFKKKSLEKINSMMEDGVTVLLVSHSINQIRKICDRCIWIENGKVIMDGDCEKVCNAYVKSANRTKR